VSADPKEVLHHAVDGRKALQLGRRLEAAHLALALSGRLMRHLGAVVRVLIRAVDDLRPSDLGDRRPRMRMPKSV
jgi:hypothetical protein